MRRRHTVAATVNVSHTSRFQIGRLILLVATALMTFNYAVLIFALDDATLFLGYAAFNLYALVIIAIPFRQRARWAWYATWILPIGLAIPAFSDPNITFFYL